MSAMLVAAGVGVAGAAISANATGNAASAETNAANSANATEMAQYNQNRQDMMPWLQSGQQALGQLNQQLPNLTRGFSAADFVADPGYQFNLQQGQQAIERSAAAKGGLSSGATMKSLASYSQGLANSTFDDAFNRYNTTNTNTYDKLAGVAGVGQQAAATDAANGTATAGAVAGNTMAAGNATAASNIAQGNNINSLLGNGMNTWMSSQILNRFAPQNPGVSSVPSTQYGATNTGLDSALGNYSFAQPAPGG